MHQSILMHADVDERAKIGDVGDHPFEHHPRLQVGDSLDPLLEACRDKVTARIAPRLFELAENVAHRRQAEALIDEGLGRERAQRPALADDLSGRTTDSRQDAVHQRIGLGMHSRRIERVVAVEHTQEACRLLEGLVAKPRHIAQSLAVAKRAIGIAMRDDALGHCRPQSRHSGQQGNRGGIEVDAHRVDAILDHCVQASG